MTGRGGFATTLGVSLFDDAPQPPRKPSRSASRGREPAPKARVESVAELTGRIARRLGELGPLAVEGEVSALKRAASGHVYFALKDEDARIDCKLWRTRVRAALAFDLTEGAHVVCHGKLDVYAPRGSYSLIVERIEQRGIGELLARLERLKAELARRGWFERRRPRPELPRCIGVVTSRDADGWRDFLRTRSLRWPGYPLRLAHTRVQGPGAAAEIAAAIARLDASGVDVICIVRGGGSLEDLWAFNELEVAQAVWEASVPVITGVGHESDTTLVDWVADHRAHTPTDAAQTVLPDRAALFERLERAGAYLAEALERQLSRRAQRLADLGERGVLRRGGALIEERRERCRALARRGAAALSGRLDRLYGRIEELAGRLAEQSPRHRLARLEACLAGLAPRLKAAGGAAPARREERLRLLATRVGPLASARLEARVRSLELLGRSLEAVSPLAVLERGYSITRLAGGGTLRSAAELEPGVALETVLRDGVVRSTVEGVEPDGGV